MGSDLFSVFDFGLGSNTFLGDILPWHGGLVVALFTWSFFAFFFSVSEMEAGVLSVAGLLTKYMPKNVFIYLGVPHIMVSLFFCLLSMCLLGFLPYTFSLPVHIVVSAGLSVPFWFMTFMVAFNPNWRLMWIKSVCDGNIFVASFIVIGCECLSVLIRPITLAIRLMLNVGVGVVLMKLVSMMAAPLFFPFSFCFFSLPKTILVNFSFGGLTIFSSGVECVVMFLQTGIFYMLVLSYLEEVQVKPE